MLLVVIVFFAVFLVIALLATASGTGASEREKQALARLNAVLVGGGETHASDELVDIQKEELLSAIPFLNRLLLQLEIAPKLRRMLYQAQLSWTPGGLILMSGCIWILVTYAVYLRTGSLLIAAALGLVPAGLPFAYVLLKRNKQFNKFEEGLPAALELMVNGLRGGQSLVSALG